MDQPRLDLSSDKRAALQATAYLSADALWTMTRVQMLPDVQQAMSHIMEKNSQGAITAEKVCNLSALGARGHRLTLCKAQAMQVLLDRGSTVSLEALQPIAA